MGGTTTMSIGTRCIERFHAEKAAGTLNHQRMAQIIDEEAANLTSFSLRDAELPTPKGKRSPRTPFTPPTPSEVEAYSALIGYPLSGQAWCDYYAAKGWMAGRVPMRDWKAAVRNWKASGWGKDGIAKSTNQKEPARTYAQY